MVVEDSLSISIHDSSTEYIHFQIGLCLGAAQSKCLKSLKTLESRAWHSQVEVSLLKWEYLRRLRGVWILRFSLALSLV